MTSPDISNKLSEEKICQFKSDMKNISEISKKIMDLFMKEYEELFPEILLMSKLRFLSNIKKGVVSILENLYTNIINNDQKLQSLINNIYKDIEEKYEIEYTTLEKEWNNYEINKKEKIYLYKYRKHCFYDSDNASHNCKDTNTKFILISNKTNDNIEYVICSNCQKSYKKSFILCKCFHCDEEYYSQILPNDKNIDLFQATWKEYHCPQLINNKMLCIKCKSPFYLNMKTGMLNCINKSCNFTSKPKRILWSCNNCQKDFTSEAIVYNPLDVEIIQKAIKQTLLLKHRAHPNKMPCCKLNVFFTEFYHNKNCKGILYLGEINNELIIVCEKCQAINYYARFIWTCPKCQTKFRAKNKDIIQNDDLSMEEKSDKIYEKEKDDDIAKIIRKNSLKAVVDSPIEHNKSTISYQNETLNSNNDSQSNINNNSKKSYQSFRFRANIRNVVNKSKFYNNFFTNDITNNSHLDLLKDKKKDEEKKESLNSLNASFFLPNRLKNHEISEFKIDDKNKIDNKGGNFDSYKIDKKRDEKKEEKKDKKKEEKKDKKKEEKPIKNNEEKKNVIGKRRSFYKYYKGLKFNKQDSQDEKSKGLETESINDQNKNENEEQNNNKMKGAFRKFLFLGKEQNGRNQNFQNNIPKRRSSVQNFNIANDLEKKIIGVKKNFSSSESNSSSNNSSDKKELPEENKNKESINKEQEINEDTKGREVDNKNTKSTEDTNSSPPSKIQKIPGMSDHLVSHITKRINHILSNCKISQFNLEEFSIYRKLGEGSYGIIHSLIKEKTKEKFALKKIIAHSLTKIAEFTKEFELVYQCQHPNILKIYGLNINILDNSTYSLQVLMEKGERDWDKEIKIRLQERNFYKEDELLSILKQLTSALSFMKEKLNITHRDIKPQNVLIFKENKDTIYKLADFGEAKEVKVSKNLNTLRGTELYMSPALYNGLKVNRDDVMHDPFKSDLFSLGFCLVYAATMNFNLLYELRNMNNDLEIKKRIKQNLRENYSEKFIWILTKMVELDENNRFDFKELQNEIDKIYKK